MPLSTTNKLWETSDYFKDRDNYWWQRESRPVRSMRIRTPSAVDNSHDGLVDAGGGGHDAEQVQRVPTHPHHKGHEADGLEGAGRLRV